jgi:UDP-N-acetylmuramyl pentapeptide phosphotransferase/UDP-N-acetylglucosamine-1-phosphate transferase
MPLLVFALELTAAAALITAMLIIILRPLLARYALARPNARSSHKRPTPQGGGIAVLAAAAIVGAYAFATQLPAQAADNPEMHWLIAATGLLAAVGAMDDLKPLPALPRLALHVAAVTMVAMAVGDAFRIVPALPLWLERGLVVLAGVWFVNLVNFMDGIDWMTAAEMTPLLAAVVCLGAAGRLALEPTVVAAVLLGGLIGFAPFNKPVAKLFLGDVGSLPLGLLVGWLLYRLAGTGALAAAVLLPLYYLADATITLLRRLARGERVWEAHRAHFYQQAVDRRGLPVAAVVAHVFALNLLLAGLAIATVLWPAWPVQAAALATGGALVALVLRRFAAGGPLQATA